MFKFIGSFALSLFVASACSSMAAEFELRQDLFAHIQKLQPMFGLSHNRDNPVFDLPTNRTGNEKRPDRFGEPNFSLIRLSGVIEKGDRDKLQAFVQQASERTGHYGWALVLESPGGNFLEGMAIGRFLAENLESSDPSFNGIYVLEDTECLSACSLIFALATPLGNSEGGENSRYIEDGARVGFHMGLVSEEVSQQQAKVGDIMNLTYDIIASYMRIIIGGSNPPELLQEALKHRTKDSFLSLTGDGIAYDYGFNPVSRNGLSNALSTNGLSMYKLKEMCEKLIKISQYPIDHVSLEYLYFDNLPGTVQSFMQGNQGNAFMLAAPSGEQCLFETTPNNNLLLEFRGKSDEQPDCATEKVSKTDICAVDQKLSRFATSALLAEVSYCSGGIFNPLNRETGEMVRAFKPLADVKVRSTPSLGGQHVSVLAKGAPLEALDCQITGDNQAVWTKVKQGDKVGWVSSRFLVEDTIYDWLSRVHGWN